MVKEVGLDPSLVDKIEDSTYNFLLGAKFSEIVCSEFDKPENVGNDPLRNYGFLAYNEGIDYTLLYRDNPTGWTPTKDMDELLDESQLS